MFNSLVKCINFKPNRPVHSLNKYRYLSSKIAAEKRVIQTNDESTTSQRQQGAIAKSEKLGQIHAKQTTKKPQRPPFIKNIFLGKFDTEILTYPQVLDKEGVEKLERDIQPVQHYYTSTPDGQNKTEYRNAHKQLKLFALQANQLAGGRELNLTETCKFNELIAQRTSNTELLNSEAMGVQALLQYGTKAQINKYLEGVINGTITIGLCIAEEKGRDPQHFQTKAVYDAKKNVWLLNGHKLFVINGDSAELLLVFAKTKTFAAGMSETDISAFLVERTFGGVLSRKCTTTGLEATNIAHVEFANTPVPAENLLGVENRGLEVYAKVQPQVHLTQATACCALARIAFDKFVAHCKDVSTLENTITESELVQEKISHFAADIYAMESMVYLTAGLLDEYEDQDCQVEAAITKCFSAEQTMQLTRNIMQFIGSPAFEHCHWSNVLHHDALSYSLLNEGADTMKLVIALQGLRHAGQQLQQLVEKIRNPLHHTSETLKRMWKQRQHNADNPSLTLQLRQYVHPSATTGAEWLEYSVLRVQYAAELMLAHHGAEIIHKHVDLRRLAECVIDVYAMVAVLGRASRAYCIGLAHADGDMILAHLFAQRAMSRVKERIRLVHDGPFLNNDAAHGKIADKVFHVGAYFPEHPLKINF